MMAFSLPAMAQARRRLTSLRAFKVREKIAPYAFPAALPQTMLSHGALAVLGHVERAWGYSFISPSGKNLEHQAFISAMRTLMNGNPVGLATDASFNMRYAEMSSDLSADLEELQWDSGHLDDAELVHRWTANNDARNYVVLGDPAARLPLAHETEEPEGPADIGTITAPATITAPEAGELAARKQGVQKLGAPDTSQVAAEGSAHARRRWKAPFRGVRLR